jgi:hypothetical protein
MFFFFAFKVILIFLLYIYNEKKTYLFIVNLIMTNESYKKIKILLEDSIKFFWGREIKLLLLLYYSSDECKWIWMKNVFERGFNFC